ncbi:autotransporter [Rodentibacter trehalosifermentans]|uniref:Autotransporter n=1 Tax=Rodentibacter trehalosifermentans TaxID=1908263 RepID=A0A1V3J3T4_9PAST|nr:AEC family transporter [Rodentibacter trehalosifermentans]OOF49641.1 autotransporter [Rodentibacter trehalosifermentans]
MDIAFLLGNKIIELTLVVLMGYGLVKAKLLKSEDSKPLSIIGLYIISPAVMIEAFQIDYTPEILRGLMLSLAMAIFLQLILIATGSLLKRLFKLDPIEHAASIYSNSGNLIIPIVMSLFGKEWVIYASCFIVVQTFLFWTHCRLIIVGKGNLSLKVILKNINMWSIFIGIILFAFQIKLPPFINGTLSSVGVFIGPNAMLIAGMLIASIPLRNIFSSKRIYLITALRLVIIPLFLLVIVKLCGFAGWVENGETIAMISFLATTSPSAATVTQMALIFGNNAQKASAIYGVTTFLCVFTMPLVIALYQMW